AYNAPVVVFNPLQVDFTNFTLSSTATVASTVNSYTLAPTVEVATTTMKYKINGGALFASGNNVAITISPINPGTTTLLTIITTSGDLTTHITYTWSVHCQSNDAAIAGLTFTPPGAGLVPTFVKTTFAYTLQEPASASSVAVTATLESLAASYQVRINA